MKIIEALNRIKFYRHQILACDLASPEQAEKSWKLTRQMQSVQDSAEEAVRGLCKASLAGLNAHVRVTPRGIVEITLKPGLGRVTNDRASDIWRRLHRCQLRANQIVVHTPQFSRS